jgi:hypothetical protein
MSGAKHAPPSSYFLIGCTGAILPLFHTQETATGVLYQLELSESHRWLVQWRQKVLFLSLTLPYFLTSWSFNFSKISPYFKETEGLQSGPFLSVFQLNCVGISHFSPASFLILGAWKFKLRLSAITKKHALICLSCECASQLQSPPLSVYHNQYNMTSVRVTIRRHVFMVISLWYGAQVMFIAASHLRKRLDRWKKYMGRRSSSESIANESLLTQIKFSHFSQRKTANMAISACLSCLSAFNNLKSSRWREIHNLGIVLESVDTFHFWFEPIQRRHAQTPTGLSSKTRYKFIGVKML